MNLPRFGDFAIKPLAGVNLEEFNCDKGLEEFFKRHAHDTETELIAKTYFLCHDKISEPLVGFSLSFASIKATTEINMLLPESVQYKSYPALLIGRFATHNDHLQKGYGRIALSLIKGWFARQSQAGCRFIVVHARKEAVPFYAANSFDIYPVQSPDTSVTLMFFDLMGFLIQLKQQES